MAYGQKPSLTLDSLAAMTRAPKIGLALSGGAAHGLAHIGVIQYLDEIGLDVDYITGTSMGAVIGIAKEMIWDVILNNKISLNEVAAVEKKYHDKYPLTFVVEDNNIQLPQGFLNTNRLELELAKLFAPATLIENFDELPRAFRCFGVDIEKGNIIAMDHG